MPNEPCKNLGKEGCGIGGEGVGQALTTLGREAERTLKPAAAADQSTMR